MTDLAVGVDLLEAIKNPYPGNDYDITIESDELTFIGKADQVDFGHIEITYSPRDMCIELKSLKKYIQSFRDRLYSYERITNLIFLDLANRYDPLYLSVSATMKPRGGASTTVSRTKQASEVMTPPVGGSPRRTGTYKHLLED